MSTRIEEQGGTAFPTTGPMFHNGEESVGQQPGMTLRDYFAAKAMVPILEKFGSSGVQTFTAEKAYAVADAMLAERQKERAK